MSGLWGKVDFENPEVVFGIPDSAKQNETEVSEPGSRQTGPSLPSPIHRGQLLISADASLHNRPDLIPLLGLNPALDFSDEELLLAAYEKWGSGCVDFLLGEFAFAIWDKRLQRLFCCRDHLGFRSFLYSHQQTRFIFASDIDPII